jgi:hypothetical protein
MIIHYINISSIENNFVSTVEPRQSGSHLNRPDK